MDDEGRWQSVFADTGKPAPPLERKQARDRARKLTGNPVTSVTRLDGPDQWTVNSHVKAPGPLWRVALHDDAGTHLYLSRPTGEVIHSTTFHERAWGYAGPVIHWIYPTQLRELTGVWRQVVIWLSGIATLACLSGVVLGLMLMRRNKHRGGLSPFRGWFRWHHYLGLTFGLLATTWVFSGLLSMGPFHWNTADRDPSLARHLGTGSPGSHHQAGAPGAINSLWGNRSPRIATAPIQRPDVLPGHGRQRRRTPPSSAAGCGQSVYRMGDCPWKASRRPQKLEAASSSRCMNRASTTPITMRASVAHWPGQPHPAGLSR